MCIKIKEKKVEEKIVRKKVIKYKSKDGVVYVKCPNCNTTVSQFVKIEYTPNKCPYCDCYLEP